MLSIIHFFSTIMVTVSLNQHWFLESVLHRIVCLAARVKTGGPDVSCLMELKKAIPRVDFTLHSAQDSA